MNKMNAEKAKTILGKLKFLANPDNVKGMARFGIKPKKAYGISIPNLRNNFYI